ncbi:hypothetical protein NQ176_g7599 [Zarea fungicola]|uniref:Uncharacterized protein n=1 Tax=Zarea fungicola TaxID=93591 RepID=A0ACC1MX93_9HYPO|nr:hypothetical protein NQ176_g7599 [Lecanicillium fungicola]
MREQLEQFLYTGNDTHVEELTRYKRHGFHLVILGDVLPKSGTSVLKLGFGAFATVWLARDLVDKYAHPNDNEAAILSELHRVGQGKAGLERIIQLFDVFTIKGPNGFHECLVTEVISPLSDPDVVDHRSLEAIHPNIRRIFFLHKQGVVHGDPHLANFGAALPQLEQFNEDDITEYFANPKVIPVVPRDTSFPLSSVPPWVTPCVSIADFLQSMKSFLEELTICTKILDFGKGAPDHRDTLYMKSN